MVDLSSFLVKVQCLRSGIGRIEIIPWIPPPLTKNPEKLSKIFEKLETLSTNANSVLRVSSIYSSQLKTIGVCKKPAMSPFHVGGDKVGAVLHPWGKKTVNRKREYRDHTFDPIVLSVCAKFFFFGTKVKRICYKASKNSRSVPGVFCSTYCEASCGRRGKNYDQ